MKLNLFGVVPLAKCFREVLEDLQIVRDDAAVALRVKEER